MSDLIDRQEAIDAIMGEPPEAHYPSWYAEIIQNLPSAQPELVRCKECKFYDITHPYGTIVADAFHCKINDRFYEVSHFCGYGERRE